MYTVQTNKTRQNTSKEHIKQPSQSSLSAKYETLKWLQGVDTDVYRNLTSDARHAYQQRFDGEHVFLNFKHMAK